ncbi:hypothetical protein [Kurthia senegalensis]|uniref:hypothetical protein n=1 Tax=Kurthia senegalensis TaxID=1033740 RepID=UPI001F46717E|nr:hypothetical protein [Kurthia senegalensis]
MMEGKLNWFGFIGVFVGLFLLAQPFESSLRVSALSNWYAVGAGFFIYFIGVVFSTFGFLREKTNLRWINMIGIFVGLAILSVFMF